MEAGTFPEWFADSKTSTDTSMLYLLTALIGIASWYGPELEGRPTASGEPFDPTALTAASWFHPIGTRLEVTNLTTERSVEVRINDRGPARRLGRLIDLSQASFAEIAELEVGLVQVRVRVIEEK
jgi:rare lipoprotein A